MAGPSILIVDDEAFMRRVLRQTLSTLGCNQVTDVGSGAEALALLGERRFDLIMSDIYMPNMSGLELLKRVRTGRANVPRDSRFIVLTSFSNTEVLSSSLALDVNGFLVKPIKSELMKKNILRALRETMYLRSEGEYESVHVDEQWASKEEKKVTEAVAPAVMERETVDTTEVGIEVPILQIPPDSVLVEGLVAKDGTLLLTAGQRLTPQIINRLQELYPILRSDTVRVELPEGSSKKARYPSA